MIKRAVFNGLMMILIFSWLCTNAYAKDLVAVLGIIPPHSTIGDNGKPTGGFVEVVRAIDSDYKDGHIDIQLYPIVRAFNMLKAGQADFLLPYIPPYIPPSHLSDENLPYTFASKPIVQVSFVLYTRGNGPVLNMEHLDTYRIETPVLNMEHLDTYRIETLRGAAEHFPFKIGEIDSFRQGLMKVISKRSDGFIVEQDAADKYIRAHRLKNIRRTLYSTWNSSIAIPKGERGREIDRIISTALRKLKKSGELQKITQTIHKPYEDWQPYQMNW
jgi:polar amino acid transport system substrate-binding protein